jgi:lipopolysaccharide transport system ATP-binding protein
VSDLVIRSENLGKKYLIGHEDSRERYTALRDVVARAAKGFARSAADMVRGRPIVPGDEIEEFWALKDVSFEVKRGEAVGIIGRNGAGKSTLLKVLSRITEPSEGRVRIKGRVASLLEVGTGFHPELTGRENIFLNGAILGMTRAEIRRKFDEIVAFAEVEKFLDTPVKRYSSGMYVRLAFAVAAHLEPEILVVDEVLAVGDADFQKKCLGKMQDVACRGRTVLFVSHNMAAIQRLCDSCIHLQGGSVKATGSAASIVHGYMQALGTNAIYDASVPVHGELAIERAELELIERAQEGVTLRLHARVRALENIRASFDVRLKDGAGAPIGFASMGELDPSQIIFFSKGDNALKLDVLVGELSEGRYLVSLDLVVPNVGYIQRLEDCISFELERRISNFGRVHKQAWGFGSLYFPTTAFSITSASHAPI